MSEPKIYGQYKCPVCGQKVRCGEACAWCEMKNPTKVPIPENLPKPDVKDMTDAELVEAVAREVIGWKNVIHFSLDRLTVVNCDAEPFGSECFDPFHDANDLQMVKDKFDYWEVDGKKPDFYEVFILNHNFTVIGTSREKTEARAWLEAALMAGREK